VSAPDAQDSLDAVREPGDRLVRDILESLCRRDGLSLESTVVPGEPARNYELADRLGIGHVFLGVTETQAASLGRMIKDAERQGWTVTRDSATACAFRKGTVTVIADISSARNLVTLANGLRAMGLEVPGSVLAGLAQVASETPVRAVRAATGGASQ